MPGTLVKRASTCTQTWNSGANMEYQRVRTHACNFNLRLGLRGPPSLSDVPAHPDPAKPPIDP
eukprot:544451-Pelagomonas_calceolata.AAC.3